MNRQLMTTRDLRKSHNRKEEAQINKMINAAWGKKFENKKELLKMKNNRKTSSREGLNGS